MKKTARSTSFQKMTRTQKIARLVKVGGPVLAKLHEAAEKEASADAADFAAWAILRDKKYSASEARNALDRLRVPYVSAEDAPKAKRGPFKIGETVTADKHNNADEANVDACEQYHQQFGQVEKIESDAVIIRFDDNKLIRFEGPNKPGKTLGIGRGTRPSAVSQATSGRAMIEVVYISQKNAKPPSKSQVEAVLEYVAKGEERGDKRSRSYYSGMCSKQGENKKDKTYFFTVWAQQRERFPRSINPQKGTLLYLGRLGGRPGGWKGEYEAMLSKSTGKDK